jgi:predicted transcriptional regulator
LRYRSRTDIIAKILRSAAGEYKVGVTRIMYESYTSYAQIKEYLPFLVHNGFLEYDEGKRKYRTTKKGKYFLKLYSDVDGSLKAVPM